MTFEEPPTGLIPWFSKTEGNTYATIAASPSPLRGKPTQAEDVVDATVKALEEKLELEMSIPSLSLTRVRSDRYDKIIFLVFL